MHVPMDLRTISHLKCLECSIDAIVFKERLKENEEPKTRKMKRPTACRREFVFKQNNQIAYLSPFVMCVHMFRRTHEAHLSRNAQAFHAIPNSETAD